MSVVPDHPDIEKLPDVLEGIPVKESIRQLFRDPANGAPDNISKAGCLALARLSNSFLALINHQAVNREILWNAWRKAFPVTGSVGNWQNNIDFSCHVDDGKNYPFFIDFSNFEFGDGTNFNRSKWPLSVNFKKCKWGNYCDLSRVEWGDRGDFLFAEWGECCNFKFSQWGSDTNFSLAKWGIFCTFIGSTWGDRCRFISSQWSKNCNFFDSSWGDDANFSGAKWGQGAYFVGAQWRGSAYLEGTQWGRDIDFSGACWFGKVNFGGVDLKTLRHLFQDQKQSDKAKDWSEQHGGESKIFFNMDFSGVRFLGDVDFSNRKFTESVFFGVLQSISKKPNRLINDARQRLRVKRDFLTSVPIVENDDLVFELDPDQRLHVVFGAAPKFHGGELHQDTSFEGAEFPKPTGSEEAARAFRTLKLAFSKQQAIREEQRFFKLEMEEETRRETGLKRQLFVAYKYFSDYGFSVTRPFTLLIVFPALYISLFNAFLIEYQIYQCYDFFNQAPISIFWNWLTWSFLSIFTVPGVDLGKEIRPLLFGTGTFISFIALLIEIIQKAVALAGFFLIGLALRNLFKLK